jgi:hypothetical protein
MSSGATTPALDYAPAPRISRRRVAIVLTTLGLMACAFVGWRWGPAWRDRTNLLYAQRQVMNYDPPATRIVMSNVVEDVALLPGRASGYRVARPSPRRVGSIRPGQWIYSQPLEYVWYTHGHWQRFPAGRWEPGPAFLHRLVSDSGERRLIALELGVLNDRLMIYCRSLKPMSWTDDGDLLRRPPMRTLAGWYHIRGFSQQPLRMYAGRADPSDASAFTIRCESEEKPGLIHGRLGDNGDVMLYVTEPWLQERWGSGAGDEMIERTSPHPARRP